MRSVWANVGDIIHGQIPDKNGKTIPRDVTMGSYELRDLDHIGVGYLYEGKLVIDKTWGHGYYGCAGCCGYEEAELNPNPLAGGISTGANDTADGQDLCSNSWVDVTSEAYDWASTNPGIVSIANAYSKFVSVGGVTGSTQIQLQRQLAREDCPVEGFEPQNTQTTLACPTSVSVAQTDNIPLSSNDPPYRTGIGATVQMSVGPSSGTQYNGVQIVENVTSGSGTSCSAALLSQPAFKNACFGSDTFTVGSVPQPVFNGQANPQTNNAFWDVNTSTDASDDMAAAGNTQSCMIVCNQTFSCNGTLIGSFVITRKISHGTLNSVGVTNVSVTKAAQ